ncbi:hypothetical protein [Chryseobacterium lathyri]|jgi:hypothetical protein|nr:hypothetical protein [Chryseobacterium lathyri]
MKFTIEQIKAAPKSEKRSRFSEVTQAIKNFGVSVYTVSIPEEE